MASTSRSSIQKSFKYDVFLSFRGEDTRKNFVDHLYHALKQKSISTYRDDEVIKKGEKISEQLIRSIEESKFYIIVFSKDYASSSWCLDELVKIIECQKKEEHTAYPVFYDVKPTEVRKQSGAVGKAFTKHIEGKSTEKWREALREAADLAGWELENTLDGHEAVFIQKIVKEISLELHVISLSADGKLVGMNKRVKDVYSSLEMDIDDVRMIGIKGIGGGGKTTLVKAVFDQISILYESSSFIENVREISANSLGGLKSLQIKVLSDVLKDPTVNVTGVSDLKGMMKKTMCVRKVLVVLDDVDHIDQLEALVGEPSWFKPGSRVIITTRDKQVLVAHGIPENLILDVNLLSPEEANTLFTRCAFGRENINHGFKMLSDQFVSYAAGLPLTIKVLGSLLHGQDELEWTDELERLKTIPLIATLKILELSYDSLEEDRKEIFLDVACMLKGWEKEKAIRVLESRGFHARSGLKVLEQKSLITVSHSGHLSMHDHIEEMGKNIARRLYPNEPHKHSRLWIEEEVKDILVEDKGTEATRCIRIPFINSLIVMKGLRNMKELRFLNVESKYRFSFGTWDYNVPSYDDTGEDGLYRQDFPSYVDTGEDSLYLPDGLQYFLWDGYPFTCLPKSFHANNLVGLELRSSKIHQLWEGEERKGLKKLKFIDLLFCELRTLDIGLIPNLERLYLKSCSNLAELHIPIKSCKLKFLSILFCHLKTLDLAQAQNLEVLIVKQRHGFIEFHMPIEIRRLKHLHIENCKFRTLNLSRAENLQTLTSDGCKELEELHMPVDNLQLKFLTICNSKLKILDLAGAQNLEKLNLKKCEELEKLHMPIESLMLKHLFLQCPKLKTFNLGQALNLEMLDLKECEELEELHVPLKIFKLESFSIYNSKLKILDLAGAQNVKTLTVTKCDDIVELHMPVENLMLNALSLQCSKLKTLNLRRGLDLKTLTLEECEELEELYMPAEYFKLAFLRIRNCKLKILDLAQALNLNELTVERCDNMVELHLPVDCPMLVFFSLQCSRLKTLNLGRCLNLRTLIVKECEELEELHTPIEYFKLGFLEICNSKLKMLDLAHALNLKKLTVEKCEDMVELHMPIESLMLIFLSLQCSKLKTLNLERFLNLKRLTLKDCEELEQLHAPIGRLNIPVHINACGCNIFSPFEVNHGSPVFLSELHVIYKVLRYCMRIAP